MTSDEAPPRRLQFELRGDMQEVMRRVQSVQTFLLDAGCSAACAQQMALVAEEIFANIVQDAWPGRAPGLCVVDVAADVRDDGIHVSLRTEDDGIAFDPTQAEAPDLDASLEERRIGGVGILLVKTMTDAQRYRRVNARNVFEVRKLCPR